MNKTPFLPLKNSWSTAGTMRGLHLEKDYKRNKNKELEEFRVGEPQLVGVKMRPVNF